MSELKQEQALSPDKPRPTFAFVLLEVIRASCVQISVCGYNSLQLAAEKNATPWVLGQQGPWLSISSRDLAILWALAEDYKTSGVKAKPPGRLEEIVPNSSFLHISQTVLLGKWGTFLPVKDKST